MALLVGPKKFPPKQLSLLDSAKDFVVFAFLCQSRPDLNGKPRDDIDILENSCLKYATCYICLFVDSIIMIFGN